MLDRQITSEPQEERAALAPATASVLARWQRLSLGVIRMLFGAAWAVDATFKWEPSFTQHFVNYLHEAAEGQPLLLSAWIQHWIKIVDVNPPLFAHIVAVGETAIALGLLAGAFSGVVDILGSLLVLVIWSTAQGFGGPYKPGSTDIGAAVIYIFVFATLFLTRAGRWLGVDGRLGGVLGRWNWLASGR